MTSSTTWRLYTIVKDVWEVMLADVEQATQCIYLEQYIFAADNVGQRFFDALCKKAASGVEVRILIDGGGSYFTTLSSQLTRLQEAGAQVRIYNEVRLSFVRRALSWYFRDHRKLLVVDGRIAHTGGVGISDRMAEWRDTHIRVVGVVVKAFEQSFQELWFKCRNGGPHVLSYFPSSDGDFDFVQNSASPRRRFLYHRMRDAVRNAQKSICLTNSYFVPDLRLFNTLRLKAKQGVDVRILLPLRCDHPILDLTASSYFGLALHAGIKVYLYSPGVLHAKVMVVDDYWSSLGSMNFDSLSFRYNLESNMVSSNPEVARTLQEQFLVDIAQSKEVVLEEWNQRGVVRRIREALLWPFHGLL